MHRGTTAPYAQIFKAEDDAQASIQVGEFRKSLFIDQLGWQLEKIEQREVDQFDTPHALYAKLEIAGKICGTFRAIRCDHHYLSKSIFPQLATTRSYPELTNMWEISRFGVWPHADARHHADMLYALMFQFGLMRQARALVAVTDLYHERYLARRGIRTRRYGKPQLCGTDVKGRPLTLVAGEIPIERQDQTALRDLLSTLNGVTINDQTLVFGRSRVQA